MICLKCGVDNQILGPSCGECGWPIGLVADGRGFLPQIYALKDGLADGSVSHEVAVECLHRLELALSAMINNLDQTGAALVQVGLDDTQSGVLGGFLAPLREGLEHFLEVSKTLDPDGDWSDEVIKQLEEHQVAITRGSEGVAFLTNAVQGFLMEKLAAGETLEPLPVPTPAQGPAEDGEDSHEGEGE